VSLFLNCDPKVIPGINFVTQSILLPRSHNQFLTMFSLHRETEQYAKREEFWREIEELARRKNPGFESLLNDMQYLAISNNQNNNDYTNEDDFTNDPIDAYSKDVSYVGKKLYY
jgi:hypothetical protein